MSFVKKIVKGAAKVVKKVFKTAAKVVKKYWKPILAVGAIVLTAGIATVGFSGLSAAVSSQGLFAGVGSVMKAGAGAMLGTFGIGSGASGAAAAAAGVEGATLFSGSALASSAFGQALGMSGAAPAATGAGGGSLAAGVGGSADAAMYLQGAGGAAGKAAGTQVALNAAQGGGGGLLNWLSSPGGRMITGMGYNALQGYQQQKAIEEQREYNEDYYNRNTAYAGVDRYGNYAGTDIKHPLAMELQEAQERGETFEPWRDDIEAYKEATASPGLLWPGG